jgi:hypothetical protein
MKTLNLLLQALRLGFSLDANKKIVPYFLGCVGWISVASAIVPSLEYLEFVGGAVFFVFMTSLIINEEHAHNGILPLPILVKRVQNLFVVTVISTLIIGVGLLLLVVPGIVASKRLIYSGIMVALGKANASHALNMSKSLSNVNGYKLLGGNDSINTDSCASRWSHSVAIDNRSIRGARRTGNNINDYLKTH